MNSAANAAKTDHEARNRFIAREELHIKKLTARILKKSITESDDEYAIALSAVNEAIDRYDEAKGDFWLFASYLIKNRIYDFYRKENLHISQEIPVEEKPNQTAVTETTSR